MNRVEFTKIKNHLVAAMFLENENPIEDYLKRSDEEQMRLFMKGLSKCDGVKKISQHQLGKAIDIYFLDPETNKLCDPKRGWDFWHGYWEAKGGEPELLDKEGKPWDRGHFEVR